MSVTVPRKPNKVAICWRVAPGETLVICMTLPEKASSSILATFSSFSSASILIPFVVGSNDATGSGSNPSVEGGRGGGGNGGGVSSEVVSTCISSMFSHSLKKNKRHSNEEVVLNQIPCYQYLV